MRDCLSANSFRYCKYDKRFFYCKLKNNPQQSGSLMVEGGFLIKGPACGIRLAGLIRIHNGKQRTKTRVWEASSAGIILLWYNDLLLELKFLFLGG